MSDTAEAKVIPPITNVADLNEKDHKLSDIFDYMRQQKADIFAMGYAKDGKLVRAAIFFEPSTEAGKRLIADLSTSYFGPQSPKSAPTNPADPGLPDGKSDEEAGIDVVTRKEMQAHCRRIKHSGDYGICYFDTGKKKVFWVSSTTDRKDEKKYTTPDDIETGFMRVQGVEDVQICLEEDPDGYEEMLQVWPV